MTESTRTNYRLRRIRLITDSIEKLSLLLTLYKRDLEKIPLPTLKLINYLANNPKEVVGKSDYKTFKPKKSERSNSFYQQLKRLREKPEKEETDKIINQTAK